MSTVTKKKSERLHEDTYVKQVSNIVNDRSDPERMAAAEVALLELALYDLWRNREALKKGMKEQQRKDVKKFYRALARSGQISPERATEILKHLGGPDGEEDHPSGSPQSSHSGGKGSFRQKVGVAGITGAFAAESIAESVTNTVGRMTEPAVAFLKESSVGKGIAAVSDYFANKASTFQYFAKAVREYGPMVGMRMVNAYFRYGGYDVPMKDGKTEFGEKMPTGTAGQVREGLIDILSKRLPSDQARRSGAKPPSEGFIVDRNGKVIAHGVGRGSDHYLPFSSRHLRKMRKMEGGELVRRRMLGGITAEDLHTGMMMGLDRVTVVSGAGTFSMELTGRSHGIKLEHMQVLSRFQELLDGKNKDYRGFNSALDTIEAEFPLHFKNQPGAKGDWSDITDPIGPKTKIMDEIKQLFNIFDAGDGDEDQQGPRGGGPNRPRNPWAESGRTNPAESNKWDAFGAGLPGAQRGESTREYYQRQARRGRAPLSVLRDIGRGYQHQAADVPQWVIDEIRHQEKLEQKGGGEVPPERQRARPVAPPGWEQEAARANPAETGAGQTGPVDWSTSEFEFGYNTLRDAGFNVQRLGNDKASRRLIETVDNLSMTQAAQLANSPEVFEIDTGDPDTVFESMRNWGFAGGPEA